MSCCETASLLEIQIETLQAKLESLKTKTDKLYDRVIYYDEALTKDHLYELKEELRLAHGLSKTVRSVR